MKQVKQVTGSLPGQVVSFESVTLDARGTWTGRAPGTAECVVEALGAARLELVRIPGGSAWVRIILLDPR